MSSVVVDTSIVLKWVLVEPDSAAANALLVSWNRQGVTILAPVLLAYEVSNALRQRQGVVTPAEAHLLLSHLLAGSIHLDIVD